ncbi:PadR family transcriptional regulator, partial [Candidatus Sumerlaeota bacterium]|nr:PadR family transcriptional regulator [Candidatus Sumerlaeota bacterium]
MKEQNPEINGDALRGHLETMVLAVLDRGDAHGFEILRRLEEE